MLIPYSSLRRPDGPQVNRSFRSRILRASQGPELGHTSSLMVSVMRVITISSRYSSRYQRVLLMLSGEISRVAYARSELFAYERRQRRSLLQMGPFSVSSRSGSVSTGKENPNSPEV
jgi:hypothetical protein